MIIETRDDFLDKILNCSAKEMRNHMNGFDRMEAWLSSLPSHETSRQYWEVIAIETWNEENPFNEDNKINLETFLLGGSTGIPYKTVNIDGFHSLTSRDALVDIDSFRYEVACIIDNYGWDTSSAKAVDIPTTAESVQTFSMPNDDDELEYLYRKAMEP